MPVIITVWPCYLTQAGSKLATTYRAIQHQKGHKNREIRQPPCISLSLSFSKKVQNAVACPLAKLSLHCQALSASRLQLGSRPHELTPWDYHSSPAFLALSFPVAAGQTLGSQDTFRKSCFPLLICIILVLFLTWLFIVIKNGIINPHLSIIWLQAVLIFCCSCFIYAHLPMKEYFSRWHNVKQKRALKV